MATFIPGSTSNPFSNEEADSSQDANSSDDSSIDWRSDDSDDDLKESTHVEGELCETFSNSDEDEDIILEEDIVAEQAMKFSSGHFYSSEDSDTTTAAEERSGSTNASNEVAERIDQNTRGSCFNENVKDLFLRNICQKSGRSRAFNQEKYNDYCMILRDGYGGKIYSLTKSKRENYLRQCSRISGRYQLLEEKLYFKKGDLLIPVVLIQEALDVVDIIHANLAQAGYKKTWDAVQKEVYGLTEDDVLWLVLRCSICEPLRTNNTRAPLNTTIS